MENFKMAIPNDQPKEERNILRSFLGGGVRKLFNRAVVVTALAGGVGTVAVNADINTDKVQGDLTSQLEAQKNPVLSVSIEASNLLATMVENNIHEIHFKEKHGSMLNEMLIKFQNNLIIVSEKYPEQYSEIVKKIVEEQKFTIDDLARIRDISNHFYEKNRNEFLKPSKTQDKEKDIHKPNGPIKYV